ncbi:beta strand repeat-containing protein [Nitrospirillum sp. BR 11163]|uniref:beta strand repeat-containing protein n=1 Tax=Nitrospirillum sp. BR 11163 TaxID=3104323 RepID=UPI002AFF528A|nr:autotransporter domain-containing protein [Nitrospirillum sp. BR 11163]MEA1673452.1 autotransporter domain-containing protein [Nitrospirillum sp. BR 11163]
MGLNSGTAARLLKGGSSLLAVGIAVAAGPARAQDVTLTGATIGYANAGTLGAVLVTGTATVAGGTVAGIANTGAIATLTNDGTLTGTFGVLNQGSIGALVENGTIQGSGMAVRNEGTIASLSITAGGGLSANSTAFYNGGSIGTLVNQGRIGDGIGFGQHALLNVGSIGTLLNGGLISGFSGGVVNIGAMGSLGNTGTIEGPVIALMNQGTVGRLDNAGIINAASTALYVHTLGGVGLFNNSGLIAGQAGLWNDGSITTLVNTGTLSGGTQAGLTNRGWIGQVDNGATIYALLTGLDNAGTLDSVINSGTIIGRSDGLVNAGTVGTLSNSGTLTSSRGEAIYNGQGTLALLDNSGTISGYKAIANAASLGRVTNSGLISGTGFALDLSGTTGTISNTGTIIGPTALRLNSGASLAGLANQGTVIGDILNLTANALTLSGGASLGTYTGTNGGQATVSSTLANVVLGGGRLLLNDGVDVSGHTLVNTGAAVVLDTVVSVTGAYVQARGGLELATSAARLVVGDTALVSGGTVMASPNAVASYLAGTTVGTLVQGGTGSRYAGVTVTSGVTGLALAGQTGGTDLLAVAANDYIGDVQGTLGNTGTLAAATAVYIAATGSLGALVNSGVIAGGIVNASANTLNISGGVGAAIGTLTGLSGAQGRIVSTGANVVLSSGNLLLNDVVDVTGHTLVNSGASVLLTSIVSVTGNYTQTGGTLTAGIGGTVAGRLVISGAASLTGGTVAVAAVAGSNLLVGDSYTIVAAGSLTATGLTAAVSGFTATLGTISGVAATDLVLTLVSDYIGGTLGTLTNSGLLSAATAVMITPAGSLGTLANTGTILGDVVNASANDLVVTGGSDGAVGTLAGGTLHNSLSNLVFAAGDLSLGDAVDAAGHTVVNGGANIALSRDVAITGAYSQAAGTLMAGGHVLSVSDAAMVTGGVVSAGVSAGGNYRVGDSVTLIHGGAGSGYGGATVISGVAGLSATGASSGADLLAVAGNDYVGGQLDSLVVTGTLSNTAGGATALYIAASGALGTLANSGVIAGDIVNQSASALAISGGTDDAPGTLTGAGGRPGSITSRLADVRFISGTLLLNDHLDVGGHGVVNSGATLLVNSAINITGSYSQTGGGLVIGVASGGSYGSLMISGNASLAGGSVTLKATGGGALAAGSYTIVSAGGGLSTGTLVLTAAGYTVTSSTVGGGGKTQLVLTLNTASTGTTGGNSGGNSGGNTGGNTSGNTGGGTGGGTGTGSGGTDNGTGGTGNTGGGTVTPTPPTIRYAAVGLAQGGAAMGAGAALDAIAASGGGAAAAFQAAVLTPLSSLSALAQRMAVAQLAPNQTTPQMTPAMTAPTTGAISQHQQTVASLMAGPNGGAEGAAAGSDGRQGAIWGEILGGGALRANSADAAGYRASSAGLVLGADWYADDTVMAGLAFSWLTSAAVGQGVAANSLTRAGSYQLTAYSVWRPDIADQRLSVAGQVSFGYNHYDQRRWIDFLGARANANYGGEQYLGKVTVGYDLPLTGTFTLTPQYSLRAVRLTNHGYQEHDAGVANLAVDALVTSNITQEVGATMATRLDTGLGALMPELRVAWVHDYLNGPVATTGVLAGVAFASTTAQVSADGVAVGLGATLRQGDSVSLRLEYNGEYRRDYQTHAGILRATWTF